MFKMIVVTLVAVAVGVIVFFALEFLFSAIGGMISIKEKVGLIEKIEEFRLDDDYLISISWAFVFALLACISVVAKAAEVIPLS